MLKKLYFLPGFFFEDGKNLEKNLCGNIFVSKSYIYRTLILFEIIISHNGSWKFIF